MLDRGREALADLGQVRVEQRQRHDVQGHLEHLAVNVDDAGARPVCTPALDSVDDGVGVGTDLSRRQGGRDHPTLPLPLLALGAHQATHELAHRGSTTKTTSLFQEHLFDVFGVKEERGPPAGHDEPHDIAVLAEATLGKP